MYATDRELQPRLVLALAVVRKPVGVRVQTLRLQRGLGVADAEVLERLHEVVARDADARATTTERVEDACDLQSDSVKRQLRPTHHLRRLRRRLRRLRRLRLLRLRLRLLRLRLRRLRRLRLRRLLRLRLRLLRDGTVLVGVGAGARVRARKRS